MLRLAIVVAVMMAACSEPPATEPGPQVCSREGVYTMLFNPLPRADVLIVVDRSPSMADDAAALAENARRFADSIVADEPYTYDVRVGVVTSDLGGAGVPGCDASGDGAVLQHAARCGLADGFLSTRLQADVRTHNFEGPLSNALGCLLDLPLSTCPVSQPLAAAARALDGSVAANAGFRRADARLRIIIVTDGDDCSLRDPAAIAGPITGDVEATIDFRCFARGTVCTPADPDLPGSHSCVSRGDAGLIGVPELAAQLGALSFRTTVAAVTGGVTGEVADPGQLAATTCPDQRDVLGGPRLGSLGVGEPLHVDPYTLDLCAADWSDSIGNLTIGSGSHGCIARTLEHDPSLCSAALLDEDGAFLEPVAACTDAERDRAKACWQFHDDADLDNLCGPLAHTGVWIHASDERRHGSVELRCAIACDAPGDPVWG